MQAEGGQVARYGCAPWWRDEFVVVASGNIEAAFGVEVVKKPLREFTRPHLIAGDTVPVSASLGIAVAPEGGWTAEGLINPAGRPMHAAKHSGKNQFKLAAEVRVEPD